MPRQRMMAKKDPRLREPNFIGNYSESIPYGMLRGLVSGNAPEYCNHKAHMRPRHASQLWHIRGIPIAFGSTSCSTRPKCHGNPVTCVLLRRYVRSSDSGGRRFLRGSSGSETAEEAGCSAATIRTPRATKRDCKDRDSFVCC